MAKVKTNPATVTAEPIYVFCAKCEGCITYPAKTGARSCDCKNPTFYAGQFAMGSKTKHYALVGDNSPGALCGAPLHGYVAGRKDEPEVCAACAAKLPA